MKFVATTAILASLTVGLGGPAGEARLTRSELPKACRVNGGAEVFVLACDPDARAAGIGLRLGARAAEPSGEPGVARLRSDEPLQPGETVSLRWRHPSAHAVLSVMAMAPERPRRVILDLRARPQRVEVTAQADGSLVVVTPAGGATIPPPASLDVPWEPRTAHAAATRLLSAVDRMERSLTARATLCAALDPAVRPFYDLLLLDPERYPCFTGLSFFVFGDENVPRPASTVHHGLGLAVGRGRAVLRTTLTHRYHPNATSDPRRLTGQARVLLVRDAQGIWRLATVDAAAPAPCAATLAGDPAGDVVVQEGARRARDQAANAGADLVGAGLTGTCLAVRAAGPLPPRFHVALRDARDRELEIDVAGGRAVVLDTTDEDQAPTPVPGAAAHLDPDGLVVALPVALSGPVAVTLGLERSEVGYSDDARVGG